MIRPMILYKHNLGLIIMIILRKFLAIIVILQVHQELSQHSLHLCVALIDRFLCLQEIELKILQLVGITSMLVAAKYHERFPPEVIDRTVSDRNIVE